MKAKNSNTNKTEIDRFVIDRVKEKRIAKGVSQAALAYEINVTAGFIGKAESPAYATHYNLKHFKRHCKGVRMQPARIFTKNSVIDRKKNFDFYSMQNRRLSCFRSVFLESAKRRGVFLFLFLPFKYYFTGMVDTLACRKRLLCNHNNFKIFDIHDSKFKLGNK